jgi:hypothetical protein
VILEKNRERIEKNVKGACSAVVFGILGQFENREKQGAGR